MEPQQTFEEIRRQALEAARKATTIEAAPTLDSLEDIRQQALDAIKQTDPIIKEDLFKQREQRLLTPIVPAPGQAATAAAMGLVGGLMKGLFEPVSAFLPDAFNEQLDAWEEDSQRKLLGLQAKSDYKQVYQNTPNFSRFLAGTPSAAGEMAGVVPGFVVGYGEASSALKVGEAATFGAKAARTVLAAGATGGLFAAAARLEPGESRWAKVAQDAAVMGAFEMVGIPAMYKAWKQEASALLKYIPEELHPQITAIRAGVPASPEAVDAVLNAAAKDPAIAKSPIAVQAAKQKEAQQAVAHPPVTIDPLLGGESSTLAGRVVLNVDGQTVTKDIVRDPKDPTKVTATIDALVDEMQYVIKRGQPVEVSGVITGDAETANQIISKLQGQAQNRIPKGKKQRGVPGAAPPATVAENGSVPVVGDKVKIVEPDKAPVEGTVVKNDQARVVPPKEEMVQALNNAPRGPIETPALRSIFGEKSFSDGVTEEMKPNIDLWEQMGQTIPKQLHSNPIVKEYMDEAGGFLFEIADGIVNSKEGPEAVVRLDLGIMAAEVAKDTSRSEAERAAANQILAVLKGGQVDIPGNVLVAGGVAAAAAQKAGQPMGRRGFLSFLGQGAAGVAASAIPGAPEVAKAVTSTTGGSALKEAALRYLLADARNDAKIGFEQTSELMKKYKGAIPTEGVENFPTFSRLVGQDMTIDFAEHTVSRGRLEAFRAAEQLAKRIPQEVVESSPQTVSYWLSDLAADYEWEKDAAKTFSKWDVKDIVQKIANRQLGAAQSALESPYFTQNTGIAKEDIPKAFGEVIWKGKVVPPDADTMKDVALHIKNNAEWFEKQAEEKRLIELGKASEAAQPPKKVKGAKSAKAAEGQQGADELDDLLSKTRPGELDHAAINPGGVGTRKAKKLTAEEKADAYAKKMEAANNSTVAVQKPDGSVVKVPLAQLQVPLEVAVREPQHLKAHLDGSDRYGILHLDSGDLSLEGLGATQEPSQSFFRGPLFSSTDPSTQWGRDPRLFIHSDGRVSIDPRSEVPDATLRRSARILLNKGVPESTVEARTGKTLKELVEADLPMVDMQQLQDAAASRGLKATPFGTKVTLKSKNGYSKTFGDSAEAYEAILRMPEGKVNRKVEAALEAEWRMGSDRAWDPDVDVTHFMPLSHQEQGVTEVAQGKRPLTIVYTKEPKALTDTVSQLEKHLNVPEGTFTVQLLPAMDQGERRAAVLYSKDAVALQAAKSRESLNFLGISSRDPAVILQQLSTKGQGHGVYVLAGRDAQSAALYAHYRDMGSKELWKKGRVEVDTLGPYRRFSKEQKQVITYPGAGDEFKPIDLGDNFSMPGVSFAADSGDKPRIMEAGPEYSAFEPDLSFGEQPPRWYRAGGRGDEKYPANLPSTDFQDNTGPLMKVFGSRFRPLMELSKDLQAKTGVPFYEWWRAIEVGRQKVDSVIHPYLKGVNELAKQYSRGERQSIQLLFEARVGQLDDLAALEKKFASNPRIGTGATALEDTYMQYFKAQGFDEDDVIDLFRIFPDIRKHDGNFTDAMKGRSSIPKLGRLLTTDLENGVLMIDNREFDFQRIANRLIRSTATERYLYPSWKRVETEMLAFGEAGRIPGDFGGIFGRYMNEVLHLPDDLHKSLSRATRQVFDRLGGRLSETEAQDTVSMLTQMNYFANMAWRPSIALRNLLQTLQTTYPIVGGDLWTGWRYGVKWWRDPKLQEEMVRRGVVQPGAIYAPLQEVSRLVEGTGKAGRALDYFLNQGTKWHANTDDFNRVVAYQSQYVKTLRVGQEYISGKIDWPTFLEKSRLDMRDTKNGPFIQEMKRLMDAKQLEKAASRSGEELAKATQFLYSRGNQPYVMQSTLGRFLFQYGTWPAWYAENLRNMLARGSYKNRVTALARWTAVQAGVFGVMSEAFGVDASRWIAFAPLGYQGGPFSQLAIQGSQILASEVDPGSNDPIARIAKARFAGNVLKQMMPLPTAAIRDAWKTSQDMRLGKWPDAARAFLGLPAIQP